MPYESTVAATDEISDKEIQDLIDELDEVDNEVKKQPSDDAAVIGYLEELAKYFGSVVCISICSPFGLK